MGRPRGSKSKAIVDVQVAGLSELTRSVKRAADGGASLAALKKANERVATEIIKGARAKAATQGKMEAKAAQSLSPSTRADGVYVIGGGTQVPYFGGANFGAKRNEKRIIKARSVRGKRGRATLVRRGEDVDKVAKRVEAQYVSRSGKTMTKKEGGLQVKLERTKSGGVKTITGWNQFRPWKKRRDFFLYASVTQNSKKIERMYLEAMKEISSQAFPSG